MVSGEALGWSISTSIIYIGLSNYTRNSPVLLTDLRPLVSLRGNFVFSTLAFANFAYATLEFDITFLPLLAFDNT